MVAITQIAGIVNITITQGGDWSVLVDFDIDLTGYTFESKVEESDGTLNEILVTNTDLSAGQITLSMTDTKTNDLSLDTHKWYLDRTNAGEQRRYLAGTFKVIEYT